MDVRWGVLAPGRIAGRFADAMTMVEGGRIVAIGSRSRERADEFGERYGIPGRYGSYEEVVEDPSVDVVYVATPNNRHETDTLAAIAAGKHVLCEKPFALNEAQGRRMADAARAAGVFLMEAVWSRFLPAYRHLVAVVGEGRIGEVRLVEADFGFTRAVDPASRLFAPELGGGALLDIGIYPLQLCSLLLGPPDRLVAEGSVGATGIDELVAAVLHHPGGGIGVVKASIRTPMACTARIAGTEGWIDLPASMHCPDAVTITTAAGAERVDCSYQGDGLRFQIDEVHRCLADGRTESDVMPLAETHRLAATMDTIRGRLGVVYPGE
jgi:predicted dehydrogenase